MVSDDRILSSESAENAALTPGTSSECLNSLLHHLRSVFIRVTTQRVEAGLKWLSHAQLFIICDNF
jgi:hypothetical protein